MHLAIIVGEICGYKYYGAPHLARNCGAFFYKYFGALHLGIIAFESTCYKYCCALHMGKMPTDQPSAKHQNNCSKLTGLTV